MHNKERRKLEILLELRKYLSEDIIVKDIEDDISPSTEVILKKNGDYLKIQIAVTKNIIYLQPAGFIDSLEKVAHICPKFKNIQKEKFNSAKIFINNYINYFSNEIKFDIGTQLETMVTTQNIYITKNSFYKHIELSHEVLFTEREVTYVIHISLYNHKGFKQDFIVSSDGEGSLNFSVGIESQYVHRPVHNLSESDYMKYFMFAHDFIFSKSETPLTINSKFEDVKRTIELMSMMSI